jgi:hypothetical protein
MGKVEVNLIGWYKDRAGTKAKQAREVGPLILLASRALLPLNEGSNLSWYFSTSLVY